MELKNKTSGISSHNGSSQFSNQIEERELKSKMSKIQSFNKRVQILSQTDMNHCPLKDTPNVEMASHILKPEQETIYNAPLTIGGTDEINYTPLISKLSERQSKKKRGIFEEYQLRWNLNNKKIFRYLIIWMVGDDGKIEDQLKLMITYLTIIFIVILFLCGFGTTFYFHQTNKENIRYAIESQAKTILTNSVSQYKNSTESIFKGYEFVIDYLTELIVSKLQISYKVYNFDDIKQFPYKGPNRLRNKKDQNPKCELYTGNVLFGSEQVSLKCIDWYEFNHSTLPLAHEDVYQDMIDTATLNGSIDILNYVLESQLFDIFVTKIFQIYFGFEQRQAMYVFPGNTLSSVPDTYVMHSRGWYNSTLFFHLRQSDSSVFRVISAPYYDAGTLTRVLTFSKAILAPSITDTAKRYEQGKGRFMGVASVDIKLAEFQKLFEDITFYQTGYLIIASSEGKLLNEPDRFLNQVQIKGTQYEDVDIRMLIEEADWQKMYDNREDILLQELITKQGELYVFASAINQSNFYVGQSIAIILVIPYSEVYGEIDRQNQVNLMNILLSSIVSLFIFIVATIVCMIYVKKKIVHMVSAITELNTCALSLTSTNGNQRAGESTRSKKEVMEKLNEIQQNSQSETIKGLIKGFENQLKGISKLGKGGQNILRNSNNCLKYEQAEYGGTQIPSYIEPLLSYLNMKHEEINPEASYQLSQINSIFQTSNKFQKNALSPQDNEILAQQQTSQNDIVVEEEEKEDPGYDTYSGQFLTQGYDEHSDCVMPLKTNKFNKSPVKDHRGPSISVAAAAAFPNISNNLAELDQVNINLLQTSTESNNQKKMTSPANQGIK